MIHRNADCSQCLKNYIVLLQMNSLCICILHHLHVSCIHSCFNTPLNFPEIHYNFTLQVLFFVFVPYRCTCVKPGRLSEIFPEFRRYCFSLVRPRAKSPASVAYGIGEGFRSRGSTKISPHRQRRNFSFIVPAPGRQTNSSGLCVCSSDWLHVAFSAKLMPMVLCELVQKFWIAA